MAILWKIFPLIPREKNMVQNNGGRIIKRYREQLKCGFMKVAKKSYGNLTLSMNCQK